MTDPRMTPTNDAPVTVERYTVSKQPGDRAAQRWCIRDSAKAGRYVAGGITSRASAALVAVEMNHLAALASPPAGDGPSMYPKDHLENIEKAIDYCDRRLADRFGNFIRATLQQCKHDPSCGTFDNYDCDCSVAHPAALDRPRAAVVSDE